jgi:hypothetical protein
MIDQRQGGPRIRAKVTVHARFLGEMHGDFPGGKRIAMLSGNQRCSRIMEIVIGPVALRPPRAPTTSRRNGLIDFRGSSLGPPGTDFQSRLSMKVESPASGTLAVRGSARA